MVEDLVAAADPRYRMRIGQGLNRRAGLACPTLCDRRWVYNSRLVLFTCSLPCGARFAIYCPPIGSVRCKFKNLSDALAFHEFRWKNSSTEQLARLSFLVGVYQAAQLQLMDSQSILTILKLSLTMLREFQA